MNQYLWAQFEAEARSCPVLDRYVSMVQQEKMDRDTAVASAAVSLSRALRESQAQTINAAEQLTNNLSEEIGVFARVREAAQHCPVLSQHLSADGPLAARIASAALELSFMRRELLAERERTMQSNLQNLETSRTPAAMRMSTT